ncbi:MAG: putative DNA binding domain-containing protein [Erysipelotrichaceae bacterium]|nr:putative DNA binding domain-containing protein [Erysipelotrichaceae bacterium]
MNIKDLQENAHYIIENNSVECDYVEYKKSYKQSDKILKTLCAFANNYMNRNYGYLFIGVEEVNDTENKIKAIPQRPILGLDEGQLEAAENHVRALFKHVQPTPTCHFVFDKIDDRWYMVVIVEPSMRLTEVTDKGARVTGLPKGGRYIRINRDTVLPSTRQEFELLRKFAGYSFCDDFHDRATIEDLNYNYMKQYLIKTGAAEDIKKLPMEEMARALKLVGEDEYNKDRVKNFALLMFADRPEDFIPGAHVEIIMESDDGTSRMESLKFDGPIWIQAQEVRDFFKSSIGRSYTIRESGNIYHRIVKNWPDIAWNEFSTNMIVHKNYDDPNYAGIYIYPDRISFTNHNRPLPPLTIKDLNEKTTFDIRTYLNPQIKDMFYALHLIESYGSGIRRAKDALAENGNPAPVFYPDNDYDDYTQVIMYINEEYKEYKDKDDKTNGSSTIVLFDLSTLPNNQRIVFETIVKNPGLRAPAISEMSGLKEKAVSNAISKLKKSDLIEFIGTPRKGGYYQKINDQNAE